MLEYDENLIKDDGHPTIFTGFSENERDSIKSALSDVFDPEIPVDIYELGLIYQVSETKRTEFGSEAMLFMTLTSPACPVAGILPEQARKAVEELPFIQSISLELVFDPVWNPDMMSEDAKLFLGYD